MREGRLISGDIDCATPSVWQKPPDFLPSMKPTRSLSVINLVMTKDHLFGYINVKTLRRLLVINSNRRGGSVVTPLASALKPRRNCGVNQRINTDGNFNGIPNLPLPECCDDYPQCGRRTRRGYCF